MTVWSKYDFNLAATQIAILLYQDDQSDNKWLYDTDCLVTIITREKATKQIHDHQIIQSYVEDDNTSFDGDTIVFRDVQTSEWLVTISYSDIWQVPVLHFTAQMQDGTPLRRDDVISCLLEYSDDPNSTNIASDFVSIDEHPVTGIPSYCLHPCRTSGLLEILCTSSSDSSPTLQLWSWMSMILPHVGLAIHPSTFRRIQVELGGSDEH
jgi:hypothetical protein